MCDLKRRTLFVAMAITALTVAACATQPKDSNSAFTDSSSLSTIEDGRTDLVDCLLPSRVRKLGQNLTYLAPRRSEKMTATQCKIRGGEHT
jgi:hypothetical protein